jgi:Protein of unknown function (DUF559)
MDRNSSGRGTHREIALLSDKQHGVFSRSQALEAGLTRDQIEYRTTTGAFVIVDYAVYRVAGAQSGWQQRLMAACLAGPAVASHRSAGRLWGLPDMPDDLIEVTALRHRRRRSPDVIWHESYHLTERDITELKGVPVTRPIRTFLDLGVVSSVGDLEIVLNEGLRRNLLSIPAILRRLEEFGPLRPGTAAVQAVLSRYVPEQRAPESVLETRFLQLIRSAGLPVPVPQYELKLSNGSVVRIDFAYPQRMIAVELDGDAYHSGQLARKRDGRRDTQLGTLRWRVLRFDWDDVTRTPEYVLQTIDAYLDRNSSGSDTHR